MLYGIAQNVPPTKRNVLILRKHYLIANSNLALSEPERSGNCKSTSDKHFFLLPKFSRIENQNTRTI